MMMIGTLVMKVMTPTDVSILAPIQKLDAPPAPTKSIFIVLSLASACTLIFCAMAIPSAPSLRTKPLTFVLKDGLG